MNEFCVKNLEKTMYLSSKVMKHRLKNDKGNIEGRINQTKEGVTTK